MPDMDQMIEKLKSMPNGLVQFMEKWLRKLPAVRHEIDSKTATIIRDLESSIKPYEGKFNFIGQPKPLKSGPSIIIRIFFFYCFF